MKKILFLLPSNSFGGAENVTYIVRNQFRNDTELDVQVCSLVKDLSRPCTADEAPIAHSLDKRQTWAAIPRLIALVAKCKYESLIAVDEPTLVIALFVKLLLPLSSITVAYILHNTLSVRLKRCSYLRRLGWSLVLPLALKYTRSIVCVSKGAANDLATMLPALADKITTIYNPVFLPPINICPESRNFLNNLPPSFPLIVSVGRIVEQKNHIEALRILRSVASVFPASRLLIIGSGSLKHYLMQQASSMGLEENITISDPLPKPQVLSLIRLSDVFLHTALWEGLPTVLIEALAYQVPVVVGDCPSGPSELVSLFESGHLYSLGFPESAASKICSLVQGRSSVSSTLPQIPIELDYRTICNLYRNFFLSL